MNEPNLFYASHNSYYSVSALQNECLQWNNLIILLEGHITYVIGGQQIELLPGTVLFLREGSSRIRLASDNYVDFFVFNFLSEHAPSLPNIMCDAVHGAVYALLTAYDAINKSSDFDNREENEHLLACLLSVLEKKAVSQAYTSLTRSIFDYLHQNFRNKITLKDIGDFTFFSPVYCDAVFKKDTGTTIIDYLLTLRIEKSKELLSKNINIQRVAEAVGFQDSNYFSRIFKKRAGCSPTAYRRNIL